MFYRLNNLTGRLTSSSQLKALLPQGLRAAEEPAQIIYDSSFKISPIPVQEMKAGRKGGSVMYGQLNENFRKMQIKFQEENGIPVHLKGGPLDYGLFGLTMILCGYGLFETFRFYYEMSFPKKPDEEC